jgi:hypothetical protein
MQTIDIRLAHKYGDYWYPSFLAGPTKRFAEWQGFKVNLQGDYLNGKDATCEISTMGFVFKVEMPRPQKGSSPFCTWKVSGDFDVNISAVFSPNCIAITGTMAKIDSIVHRWW